MTTETRNRYQLTRRALACGSLSLAAALGGCGFLDGEIHPDVEADARAKLRAKRPYKPANPQEFAAIINAYRAENGLKPWGIDDRLTAIAAAYSRHLADAGQMTHELQPYGGLEKRLKSAGYAYLVAGENLGEGHTDDHDAFEGWRHSPAHDRGMRDEAATVFGIASAYNPNDHYQAYWCLIFARPRPPHGEGETAGPFHWGAAL